MTLVPDRWSRQPRIRHNDYRVLKVPEIGTWEPSLAVSVVIPAHRHQHKLDLALASLDAQTYPDHLLEVLVVDDGSDPPITLPKIAPDRTRLIRVDSGGWGSAHAVHMGAEQAQGDVIMRLDSDMVVYREHVEAHLRWHHFADYLAVLGSVKFVDYIEDELTGQSVLDEVSEGRIDEVFSPDRVLGWWVDRVLAQSDNLVRAGNRAFRIANGATISFSRRLYSASGGMDPDMILGGDTEFGYRLAQAGAVFVPEENARSWHLGLSQMKSRNEEGRRYRSPFVGHRVPLLREYRSAAGSQWRVPVVEVLVEAQDDTYEAVSATVLGALTGTLPDVGVTVVAPWTSITDGRRAPLDDPILDLRLIREAFAFDSRVQLVESAPDTSFPAPFRFRCPAGLVPRTDTLRKLIEIANQDEYGLILLPFPIDDTLHIARFERTEAVSRSIALCRDGENLEDVIHETFGVYWISGPEWALSTSASHKPVTVKALVDENSKLRAELVRRKKEFEKWRASTGALQKVAVSSWRRLPQAAKRRVKSRLVRLGLMN